MGPFGHFTVKPSHGMGTASEPQTQKHRSVLGDWSVDHAVPAQELAPSALPENVSGSQKEVEEGFQEIGQKGRKGWQSASAMNSNQSFLLECIIQT